MKESFVHFMGGDARRCQFCQNRKSTPIVSVHWCIVAEGGFSTLRTTISFKLAITNVLGKKKKKPYIILNTNARKLTHNTCHCGPFFSTSTALFKGCDSKIKTQCQRISPLHYFPMFEHNAKPVFVWLTFEMGHMEKIKIVIVYKRLLMEGGGGRLEILLVETPRNGNNLRILHRQWNWVTGSKAD